MEEIKCPKCGKRLKEIIYGMPPYEGLKLVKEDKAVLGGCTVIKGIEQPAYLCHDCNMKFTKDLKDFGPVYELDEDGNKIFYSNVILDDDARFKNLEDE